MSERLPLDGCCGRLTRPAEHWFREATLDIVDRAKQHTAPFPTRMRQSAARVAGDENAVVLHDVDRACCGAKSTPRIGGRSLTPFP